MVALDGHRHELLILILIWTVIADCYRIKRNATQNADVKDRYTMPHRETVLKIGTKTGSAPFAEMNAVGFSRVKMEICGDRECCKTDWLPSNCCGAVAILKWYDEDSLGECVGTEVGSKPVVSVIHKGHDEWTGEYVFLATKQCRGFRCNTGNGDDFAVDGSESVKLKCHRAREPGCG